MIIALFYSFFIERNSINVKRVSLKNENVKEYKIAFFSDTHFGEFNSEKSLEEIKDIVNEENVDIVIFGGDFFDNYKRDKEKLDLEYIGSVLGQIDSKYGKFSVNGNHDLGGGASRVVYDLFSQNGFDVLTNENEYIEELDTRIIGFDDAMFGNVNEEYYNIKSTDFNIILSHEPDIVDKISTKSSSIMFSGHTHGGQIYIPFVKLLPPLGRNYVRGVYNNVSINKNISLLVSNGVGTTFLPLRFQSKPEVCIITITNN